MALSQADASALEAAIATGVLSVEYADGRKITYRSLREMREILRMMQPSAEKPSRSFLASF
jgi:hypothetical protein